MHVIYSMRGRSRRSRMIMNDDRPRIFHWPHTQTLDYHCRHSMAMGAMQNYVMHCDVRSWRASGVMFDKTHCDRRSNNDWQDPLLVLVDEYLVDFLLKDKGVVEHCLRSCPRQVQEVELETFTFEIVEQRRVE